MTEKSVFRELNALKWRHNHSQSPVFGLVVLSPPEVKFHIFGMSKQGEEKSLSSMFFCYTYKYIVEISSSK